MTIRVFNDNVFVANILKLYETTQEANILPSMNLLMNCLQSSPNEKEESDVVYVEIRSEKADIKVTLGKVLAKLYQTFIIVQYRQSGYL